MKGQKIIDEFTDRSDLSKQMKYYHRNKEIWNKNSIEWGKQNRDKVQTAQRTRMKNIRNVDPLFSKKHNLKFKYKLTIEDIEQRLIDQNNQCAICGYTIDFWATPGAHNKLNVDHDHKTGKVRGLLCRACNHMLGLGKDSAEILRKGANYLEYWDKKYDTE